jgi:hypothetical protein
MALTTVFRIRQQDLFSFITTTTVDIFGCSEVAASNVKDIEMGRRLDEGSVNLFL